MLQVYFQKFLARARDMKEHQFREVSELQTARMMDDGDAFLVDFIKN
jgi:hypothetical protein